MNDFEPGDTIVLDGADAEVIKTHSVGDIDYLRAHVDDAGVKTVCIDDVEIETECDRIGSLAPETADRLYPDHGVVSAERYDLRSRALRPQIAHEQAGC